MTHRPLEEVLEEAESGGWRKALFVTAIAEEMAAVRGHLNRRWWTSGRDGSIYECGLFHDSGEEWLIVVAETGPRRSGMPVREGLSVCEATQARRQYFPVSTSDHSQQDAQADPARETVPAGNVRVDENHPRGLIGRRSAEARSNPPRD